MDEYVARELGHIDGLIQATRQKPPKPLPTSKINEDWRLAICPLTQQRAVIRVQPPHRKRVTNRRALAPRLSELRHISFPPCSVHNPNDLTVERIARPPFFGADGRMLEFDYPPMLGPNICDVLRAVVG